MTATTTDVVEIVQGARDEARVETIDDRLCATKRYNDYRGSPEVKLARELAFCRAYAAVPILPKLVAWREPDNLGEPRGRGATDRRDRIRRAPRCHPRRERELRRRTRRVLRVNRDARRNRGNGRS